MMFATNTCQVKTLSLPKNQTQERQKNLDTVHHLAFKINENNIFKITMKYTEDLLAWFIYFKMQVIFILVQIY